MCSWCGGAASQWVARESPGPAMGEPTNCQRPRQSVRHLTRAIQSGAQPKNTGELHVTSYRQRLRPLSRRNRRPSGSRQPRGDRRRKSDAPHLAAERSEEHTSELQSLMRISYAVFCLQKKNQNMMYRFIEMKARRPIHDTSRHYDYALALPICSLVSIRSSEHTTSLPSK